MKPPLSLPPKNPERNILASPLSFDFQRNTFPSSSSVIHSNFHLTAKQAQEAKNKKERKQKREREREKVGSTTRGDLFVRRETTFHSRLEDDPPRVPSEIVFSSKGNRFDPRETRVSTAPRAAIPDELSIRTKTDISISPIRRVRGGNSGVNRSIEIGSKILWIGHDKRGEHCEFNYRDKRDK